MMHSHAFGRSQNTGCIRLLTVLVGHLHLRSCICLINMPLHQDRDGLIRNTIEVYQTYSEVKTTFDSFLTAVNWGINDNSDGSYYVTEYLDSYGQDSVTYGVDHLIDAMR